MVVNHLAMTLNEVISCWYDMIIHAMYTPYTLEVQPPFVYVGSRTTEVCHLWSIYIYRVIILEEDHLVLHLEFQGIVQYSPMFPINHPQIFSTIPSLAIRPTPVEVWRSTWQHMAETCPFSNHQLRTLGELTCWKNSNQVITNLLAYSICTYDSSWGIWSLWSYKIWHGGVPISQFLLWIVWWVGVKLVYHFGTTNNYAFFVTANATPPPLWCWVAVTTIIRI